ncbi:16228_t:CDS:2 [Gigaspora margarita]|uniref:16228_t:CDS:1 n=1 Tax=Gigaspora margarita TaxID=4874 RepID=A0ABN7VF84_GIGMA|nr:16228_t:CDS:2 [Gigaspora margarita]
MENFFCNKRQADITDDNLMKNFQTILLITYSDSFEKFQTGPPFFFFSDINNDNLTENFQTALPIIEYSNNFKNNHDNNNLTERFKTALRFFSNENNMVEHNEESTCSQNYYIGPSQEGMDIEPQNDMDIEFQESIDKELS